MGVFGFVADCFDDLGGSDFAWWCIKGKRQVSKCVIVDAELAIVFDDVHRNSIEGVFVDAGRQGGCDVAMNDDVHAAACTTRDN